jgi:ribonuclease BN (tRNA processing enzyme)
MARPGSTLRLVPLGTNGYIPTHGRHTMSFLLLGEEALLLDAGTGVARLAEPGIAALLRPYPRLGVLLTHYHLDHVVGLVYLPGLWPDKPVRIAGPAPPLADAGPRQALEALLNPPLCGLPLADFPMPVEIVELREDRAEVAGLAIRLRRQHHPGGSVGVRVGDALAYVTDTSPDPATVELARGVDLLLHEVWKTDAEAAAMPPGQSDGGHSHLARVAEIARQAGVRRVMPVHHHPGRSAEELRELVAALGARAGCRALLPEEGRAYEIG